MFKRFSFLCCFLCLINTLQAQESVAFCDQLQALKSLVNEKHFQPKHVDDSLSSGVFNVFLSKLDERKRLFLQEDISAFDKDKYSIDDFIASNDCSFIEKYSQILSKRINDVKHIISGFETQSLNYSGNDTLRFKPDASATYFKNESQLKSFWSKRIRHNVLYEIIEKDSVLASIKKNFKRLEKEIKPKIIQKELCKLDELLNRHGSLEQYVQEAFLNAYLAYHDPNSIFFNASDKATYVNQLSNDQLSFGIITSKSDNGNIIISHIIPGSPAFVDGNFDTNDIIKSLESNGQLLETYCVSNQDVLAFTNNEKHNTITFKIKKQNGNVKSITLTKTKTKIEENSVTGYLIENEVKLGYIRINSFYSDFESPNGLGVANDVAKELYKLQKEQIEGLIIDLRFNGGGSMKEATDLSGMFINRGPLSIVKYSDGETYTIRDMNRGALFTKPIIILINNFSASASEFFAAAMQDYNRAIIIGASSYGKASAQGIVPLDEASDFGFSKLTIEKFYRITGKSHQSQGVIPDIELPNLYDNFKTEEKYTDYALQNDSVTPTLTFVPKPPFPLEKLRSNSEKRISNSNAFGAVKQLNQLIIDNYFELETAYKLTVDNVYKFKEDYHSKWDTYSALIDFKNLNLSIENTDSTDEVLLYNDTQKTINDALLNDIKTDIYISEAYYILNDFINLKTTN